MPSGVLLREGRPRDRRCDGARANIRQSDKPFRRSPIVVSRGPVLTFEESFSTPDCRAKYHPHPLMSTSVAPLQRGSPRKSARSEPESIKDQARNSLDEARMVLPGIQAVFGFQLIAIFNERFAHLPNALKWTHFASLCLVVCTIALIMTPAAYDRIAERRHVTARFVHDTAALLTVAMAVFGIAIALELVVITALAIESVAAGAIAAACALSMFALLWFYLPWRRRRQMRHKSQVNA